VVLCTEPNVVDDEQSMIDV